MNATMLFDPLALLLVWGGSALVAILRSTRDDLERAVKALWPALNADPSADARVARRAVRQIEQIAERKGISCADHIDTSSPFVRRAALSLVDTDSAESFARWASEEIEERSARHEAASAVWRSAADSAPAMGMIGTVVGLAQLLSRLDDPALMGPAMATAVLTTLYGLLLAACVAGPIASRLERLSLAERRWQESALARLEQLARADAVATATPPQWVRVRRKVAA